MSATCGDFYSRHKLTTKERTDLQAAISDVLFTCGAQIQDLNLPGRLHEVYTRQIICWEPIENLYYTAKFSPISVYCASDVSVVQNDKYPQCSDCTDEPVIIKKK